MGILNTTNKLLFILALILITCQCRDANERNIIDKRASEIHKLGFKIYENLDTFTMNGIGELNGASIKYPYFAIKVDSPFVRIQYLYSSSIVKYTSFRMKKNYYISTKIFLEETTDDFYKEVTIIYPNVIIVYEYIIYDNFEQLQRIKFKYKNKNEKLYENMTDSYYNIVDSVNEKNILTLFPTLVQIKAITPDW